jgi:hypothetical protein
VHRNQKISNQLESDYSLAARNIYDVLDTLDQQDEDDQERDDEDDRPKQEHRIRRPIPNLHHLTQLQIPRKPTGHLAQKRVRLG